MINDLNLLEADCLSATPQHFKLFLIALHPMQLVNYFFFVRLNQDVFWAGLNVVAVSQRHGPKSNTSLNEK